MSAFVGQQDLPAMEFAELARSLGIDLELFAGVPGESATERAARLAAAADILADLEHEDPALSACAASLLHTAPTLPHHLTAPAVRWMPLEVAA